VLLPILLRGYQVAGHWEAVGENSSIKHVSNWYRRPLDLKLIYNGSIKFNVNVHIMHDGATKTPKE
jgi:hypothetical protein